MGDARVAASAADARGDDRVPPDPRPPSATRSLHVKQGAPEIPPRTAREAQTEAPRCTGKKEKALPTKTFFSRIIRLFISPDRLPLVYYP